MLWQMVLVAAALAVLHYRWRRRAIYRLEAAIPAGLPANPFIGHAGILVGTDEDRMKTFQQLGLVALRQGGLTTAWMMNRLYVVVADAPAAAVVAQRCADKDDATMRFIRALIGNGSIFAPVEIWRPRRKLLAPVFGARRVADLVGVFDRHAAAAADQLRVRVGAGDFSLWDTLSAYTFDAVCETSLGVSLVSQGRTPHPFLSAFAGAQAILSRRMCAPWLYPDAVFRVTPQYCRFARHRRRIHRFIDEIIRQKKEALASSGSKGGAENGGVVKSFLELMLQGGGFSERELREEVMVLVMAGSDTTAVGACFTLLLLAQHPQVQDKLHQELVSVLGEGSGAGAGAGALTAAELARLPYLDAVLKEALRLYPPVPVTVREVRHPLTLPCGVALPAGVAVLLHTWATHRARAWGADAAAFRPERFLPPAPPRHPAQFMPFGYSVRNCLGAQYATLAMKTVLARALLQLRVLPPSAAAAADITANTADTTANTANTADTAVPPPLRVKFDIAMKHVDKYMVRVELRNSLNE